MPTERTADQVIMRVTAPTLEVLRELLAAEGTELHGWPISKRIGRQGPTVYKILERLEDRGMATSRWEDSGRTKGTPPRRLYRLTPDGIVRARTILAGPRPVSAYRKN